MERPLKFCMVSTFYPPYSFGGDGIYIYRLSNALARRGHSVDIFYCEDAFLFMNGGEPTGEFPNHERVRLFPLRSGRGLLSPLLTQQTGMPFLKGKLRKALEHNRYDVIHYHNMSLIGIAALSYGSAIKLYTAHEHWLVCPMHVLWKFNREVCAKRNCTMCQLAGGRPPQLWRKTGLIDRMLEHVDCILSPSTFSAGKHIEMGLNHSIECLPNFLPKPPETSDGVPPTRSDRPYFLFVGRLEIIKGVQNLITAFRNCPEYELLIAGDGGYRSDLERMARGSSNIRFLGRLAQEELYPLYESAVAVIVPSICFESFGMTVIEAFSRKTPVIVNDLGALPELVDESGGGFVYRSEEELIAAIRTLFDDPELRDQLGENGYHSFLDNWSEEPHLRQYMEIIGSLKSLRHDRELKPGRKSAVSATV